jgi:formylglycine-generating enzyme required for sulfatase activity
VILLAVGNRVHEVGEHDQPLLLVNHLCPPNYVPTDDVGWRKVRLASDALLEIGINRVRRHPEGERLMQRVQNLLASLVENNRLTLKERLLTAETLGRLGDSRFDIRAFNLPQRYHDKPEKNWGFLRIPAGPLVMGSKRGDNDAREDEFGNNNPLAFPYEFWINRYPVTVMQFEAFVEDGGYERAELWRGEGARVWFRNRQRAIPIAWHRQRLYPNRPVTHVSWYEANAYCAWLQIRLKEIKFPLLIDEHRLRLPTEAEWELAARDNGQSTYPWGDEEWNSWRANINRSGIGDPTPVGIYSAGATRKGLHDMAGNVWEWTLSCYRKYPYRAEVNELRSTEPRAVRGGSWANEARAMRCASRLGLQPDGENGFLGFRVIISRAEGMF